MPPIRNTSNPYQSVSPQYDVRARVGESQLPLPRVRLPSPVQFQMPVTLTCPTTTVQPNAYADPPCCDRHRLGSPVLVQMPESLASKIQLDDLAPRSLPLPSAPPAPIRVKTIPPVSLEQSFVMPAVRYEPVMAHVPNKMAKTTTNISPASRESTASSIQYTPVHPIQRHDPAAAQGSFAHLPRLTTSIPKRNPAPATKSPTVGPQSPLFRLPSPILPIGKALPRTVSLKRQQIVGLSTWLQCDRQEVSAAEALLTLSKKRWHGHGIVGSYERMLAEML
ncbi:hypothetical protein BC830DRAFT_1133363 [Chytriomyces sp. MP71]|nr:hypothetical protein BC830DRAFT_1133363 [Chytriomyces sp. MP71]